MYRFLSSRLARVTIQMADLCDTHRLSIYGTGILCPTTPRRQPRRGGRTNAWGKYPLTACHLRNQCFFFLPAPASASRCGLSAFR